MSEMTKKQFIGYIDLIEKQIKHDVSFADKFKETFDGEFFMYKNSYLFNLVFEMLENYFNDKGKLIEYFCHDLEFGKDYKDGSITFDGVNVSMRNSGELWEVLKRD